MKKALSAVLTVTMLITFILSTFTVVSVSADEVTVSGDTLKEVISFIDNYMSDDHNERIETYYVLASYMKTDAGIDTLIGILNGDTAPAPVAKILTALTTKGADLAAAKEKMIFTLNLIKAVPAAERVAAIDDFETIRQNTEDNSGVEEELCDDQEALQRVFDYFVSKSGQAKLWDHYVGKNDILRLVAAFKGHVLLTDDIYLGAGFDVKNVETGFADTTLAYITKVNGNDVSTPEEIFKEVVNSVNDRYDDTTKKDIKKVMGDAKVGLYVPLDDTSATPTPAPTDTPGARPTRRPSSNSDIGIILSSPTQAPTPAERATEAPIDIPDGYEKVRDRLTINKPDNGDIGSKFEDVPKDHWAEPYITALAEDGILSGRGDGTFDPEMGITRQEMAVVIIKTLGYEDRLSEGEPYPYDDADEIAEWAKPYVYLATTLGIYEGYDDGENIRPFRPERIISREELCAICMRSIDGGNKLVLDYSDNDKIGEWARVFVGQASYLGVASGYPDGTFRPANFVTRAEAAKMIYSFKTVLDAQ